MNLSHPSPNDRPDGITGLNSELSPPDSHHSTGSSVPPRFRTVVWTAVEDERLDELIGVPGIRWEDICKEFPGHTPDDVVDRWDLQIICIVKHQYDRVKRPLHELVEAWKHHVEPHIVDPATGAIWVPCPGFWFMPPALAKS
jgi:hypothetical protein